MKSVNTRLNRPAAKKGVDERILYPYLDSTPRGLDADAYDNEPNERLGHLRWGLSAPRVPRRKRMTRDSSDATSPDGWRTKPGSGRCFMKDRDEILDSFSSRDECS